MERESTSSRSSSQGERNQVTVLFADVAGFTSLSGQLDPEEVHDLLKPALDIMADEIHAYEGTVAQFMGDGVMALFGAPLAHEDDPQRAIYAALAIQRRLAEYGERLKPKGIEFSIRIGINTGLVMVGSVGDDLSMEYTAIGDTVNLASRMESSAEPGTVQITKNTYHLTQGYFDFEDLGEIEVKGKEEPMNTWRVLGELPTRSRISASLTRGLSLFVGREKELDQLGDCYAQAKAGSGQVVGMVGEPGAGKSRLLLQFRELLPQEECTYLEGGCIHYGEAIAYLPILGILRNYFDIGEGEDEAFIKHKLEERLSSLNGQLARILPPLQELLSLEVDDQTYLSLEPAQRRERVFESIRYLFMAESQQRPLVLAIEDLHWMDRTSEEFLSSLIDSLQGAAILLLLLYRPEYTSAWTSKTYYRQIRVDQLSDEPSTELVEAILFEGEVSPEISEFIVTKTAGNPLFIEELTRGLLEAGSIVKDNERYILSGEPSGIQVPGTIHGIISSRLDRLPEELKEILQMAAVIGREFSLRLLQALTGLYEELKPRLSSLQSLEFIYEKGLFPEPEYIFKHALTQEVAYESLLLKRRREIHERIGIALEQLYPDTLEDHYETLAHHYSQSDDADKAIHYLKLSGRKATRSYSNLEAINLYKQALRLLNAQQETEKNKKERLEVCIAIISPMSFLNYPEGSLDILQEAERLAEELGDQKRLVSVYSIAGFYYAGKGDVPLAEKYSEKSLEMAERLGYVDRLARIAGSVCVAWHAAGRLIETAEIAHRVLRLLDEEQIKRKTSPSALSDYALLSSYCGLALGDLGEFEEAKAVIDKGINHALEVGDTLGIGGLEMVNAYISFVAGDSDGLIKHSRRAIEYYEETGVGIYLSWAREQLGLGHYMQGEYEEARRHVVKALELGKEISLPITSPWVYWGLALILMSVGEFEKALRIAEEMLKLSRDYRAKTFESLALLGLGRIEGEVDPLRIDAALQHIKQGISMYEEMGVRTYIAIGHLFLGEVFEIAGRGEEALENLKKAKGLYLDMGVAPDSYWLTRTREALSGLESVS